MPLSGYELLVGDILVIKEGQIVPVDGVLVQGSKALCNHVSRSPNLLLFHRCKDG
jgi:magnesium-transporting ATPase (P-type)